MVWDLRGVTHCYTTPLIISCSPTCSQSSSSLPDGLLQCCIYTATEPGASLTYSFSLPVLYFQPIIPFFVNETSLVQPCMLHSEQW